MENKLKRQLNNERYLGCYITMQKCNEDEQKKFTTIENDKIPSNITWTYKDYLNRTFYEYSDLSITHEEMMELLEHKKIKLMKTIKNCILFFTICFIIDVIFQAIALLNI